MKIDQDLVIWPDDILKQKSEPVPESMFGEELDKLFNKMELVMKKYRGVGISAIQIGVPLRAMIVTSKDRSLYKMVNPVIEKEEGVDRKQIYLKEGCLSWPGLFVPIWRDEDCTIAFETPENKSKTLFLSDPLEARIAAHEYDHLSGITMLDHLSKIGLQAANKKYTNILRKI